MVNLVGAKWGQRRALCHTEITKRLKLLHDDMVGHGSGESEPDRIWDIGRLANHCWVI